MNEIAVGPCRVNVSIENSFSGVLVENILGSVEQDSAEYPYVIDVYTRESRTFFDIDLSSVELLTVSVLSKLVYHYRRAVEMGCVVTIKSASECNQMILELIGLE